MLKILRAAGLLLLMSVGLVRAAVADTDYAAFLMQFGDYTVVQPLGPEHSEFQYYFEFASFPPGGPVLSQICPILREEFAAESAKIDEATCEMYVAFTVNKLPDVDTIQAGQAFILPAPRHMNTTELMAARREEAKALNELADPYAAARRIIAVEKDFAQLPSDVATTSEVEARLSDLVTRAELEAFQTDLLGKLGAAEAANKVVTDDLDSRLGELSAEVQKNAEENAAAITAAIEAHVKEKHAEGQAVAVEVKQH